MDDLFSTNSGFPFPYGASFTEGGINFAVYAKPAEKVFLQIWEGKSLVLEVGMRQTGDVWHTWLKTDNSVTYTYSVVYNGVSTPRLVDPYARQLDVPEKWADFAHYSPRAVAIPSEPPPSFNHPQIPQENLVIYEMHVRGFTQDPTSQVEHPGTFLGVIEKIPHLLSLGINAVKLLPVFEFNECEVKVVNPLTGSPLLNYWGYSTVHFFCPMRRYAVKDPIKEFREMVRAFHQAGIEVILDVVYNHTAEGNEEGPTYHFKGLAKDSYYLMENETEYYNFSGCGNSVNANHPVAYELILQSLRYWRLHMGVDGFRFDLASLLTRGQNGMPLAHPALIEAIAQDPLLAGTKLFAEAWDAAGLYQLGQFAHWNPRWTEWNGKYRDHVREFIKGNPGLKGDFATRICGSEDLYETHSPLNSLNFITAHDGFTLRDLVSYNQKHNFANGENNADGSSFNDSWNCGVEGPTDDPAIEALRNRQMHNFIVALFVSAGIPMLTSGDDYTQTKLGNNNTWCQDNALNWLNWQTMAESEMPKFIHTMRDFRNRYFCKRKFYDRGEIIWHGRELYTPDWNSGDSFLAFEIPSEKIYCYFNASKNPSPLALPPGDWTCLVDTKPNDDNSYSCGIYLQK